MQLGGYIKAGDPDDAYREGPPEYRDGPYCIEVALKSQQFMTLFAFQRYLVWAGHYAAEAESRELSVATACVIW